MSTFDNDEITGGTIDGDDVTEVTMDGDVAWTAETVLDDFERSSPIDEYEGSGTDNWAEHTADPIEGSQSVESTSAFGYVRRADGNADTTRGNTYSWRVRPPGSGENIFLLYGVATSGNISDNNYQIELYGSGSGFVLYVNDGGTTTVIDDASVSGGYSSQDYTVEVDYPAVGSPHESRLYAEDGTLLATVSGVEDTRTGGLMGFYSGSTSGFVLDDITETLL